MASMTCWPEIICRLAIKNDSGGPWRVERAHQNRSRKNRPIVFGQSRTLELRNSARIVQTSRFAFSLVTRSLAHVCGGITQSRENFKVGSIPVARSFSFTLVSEHEQMSADVVGGQVYEAPGVQPVFLSQEQAIDYTTCRACFRSGEIRILKSNGAVERVIPFDETDRRL